MPLYSLPGAAQLINSNLPPALSTVSFRAASRAAAFSFINPFLPSALYLKSVRYLGMSSQFEGTHNQKKERALVLRQLLQQRLRLFQIARVEAFSEPAVDRSEQFASLLRLA